VISELIVFLAYAVLAMTLWIVGGFALGSLYMRRFRG
jgi:hypothetical protein